MTNHHVLCIRTDYSSIIQVNKKHYITIMTVGAQTALGFGHMPHFMAEYLLNY